jgi:hypothetical protein
MREGGKPKARPEPEFDLIGLVFFKLAFSKRYRHMRMPEDVWLHTFALGTMRSGCFPSVLQISISEEI